MSEIQFTWFPTDEDSESQGGDYREYDSSDREDYTLQPLPSEADESLRDFDPDESEMPTFRKYQERAIQATFAEWKKGNRATLIVHPTASGKTYTFSGVIRRYDSTFGPREDGSPRRFLVLAHRDYLLSQAARTLMSLGVDSAIEKGGQKALAGLFGDPLCVIASVQSMQANAKTSRLLAWDPGYFDAVIVDEGHHALSPIYRRILNHFDWNHLLLVTATPDRLDGRNLGEIIDSVADEYMLDEAVDGGWVCPVKVAWCDVNVDISEVKSKGRGKNKDLNEADLAEKVRPYVEKFARAIKKKIGQRQTILFAPTVEISEFMASALTSIGVRSEHLDGTSKDRDRVIDSFRGGFYQCLCNYGLFTEGFDMPSIGAVVLLRATESRALYYQMVGRGLRPNNGDYLLLVDFPWVAGSHKLVKPVEIFHAKGSKYTEEVFREAERLLDVGATNDLLEAIKTADVDVAARNRFRLEVTDGKVKMKVVEYNPLSSSDVDKLPPRREVEERRQVAATFKQVMMLEANGISGTEAMSRRRASAIISAIKGREAKGLAPYWMINKLVSSGVDRRDARVMMKTEAQRVIENIKTFGSTRDLFGT